MRFHFRKSFLLLNNSALSYNIARMHLRHWKSLIPHSCSLIVATIGLTPQAHGLGLRIPNQDAEAVSRGNAFAATADNASAMYYNPAGITQLDGQNFQIGIHSINVNSHYTSPTGNRVTSDFEIQPVPQLYYTRAIKDSNFTVGLGVYAPFGLGLQWPDNTGFRTIAEEGRLLYTTIHPAIAWRIHPTLSISAGPKIDYSQVLLRQAIGFTPGDSFLFKGRDVDFGYKLGLRWQPMEQIAFGATYSSATTMKYHGNSEASPYSASESTNVRLPFPEVITGGVSYRPNKNWNIEFDVDWTDWDRFNTAIFQKASGNVSFPFNWHSSFLYEFGVTRYLENGYWVSAGYMFSQNSTSEANFNPLIPDTDLHESCIGYGHKGEKWSWAISYSLITGPSRTILGSTPSIVGESADGKYKFFNHLVNVSLAYKF